MHCIVMVVYRFWSHIHNILLPDVNFPNYFVNYFCVTVSDYLLYYYLVVNYLYMHNSI